MEEIQRILQSFNGISLADTCNRAALLQRVDYKYVLKQEELLQVLAACMDQYKVLEVEGNRICKYETTYFDTKDLYYYRIHHAGHLNRQKIRIRKYLDTSTGFLELKQKTNKGLTIKTRKRLNDCSMNETGIPDKAFFADLVQEQEQPLFASAMIQYKRITLVALDSAERVTLDLGIQFSRNDQIASVPGYVIAEVKQDKATVSFFRQLMKQQGKRSGALSKYCMAVIYLYENVKKNRFMPHLHQLQRKIN